MSGTTTSLPTSTPRVFQGARPRQRAGDDHKDAIPRPQGHQPPGVSKCGGGTAIYPRTHIPGYETSRR